MILRRQAFSKKEDNYLEKKKNEDFYKDVDSAKRSIGRTRKLYNGMGLAFGGSYGTLGALSGWDTKSRILGGAAGAAIGYGGMKLGEALDNRWRLNPAEEELAELKGAYEAARTEKERDYIRERMRNLLVKRNLGTV